MNLTNTIVWLQVCWLTLTLRYGFMADDGEFRPSIAGALLWIAIFGLNIHMGTCL